MKKILIIALLSMIFYLSAGISSYTLSVKYLFNNTWEVEYTLPIDDENITLIVLGKNDTYITTLADFKTQPAGTYSFFWDGKDDNGVPVEGVSVRFRTSLNGTMKAILLK